MPNTEPPTTSPPSNAPLASHLEDAVQSRSLVCASCWNGPFSHASFQAWWFQDPAGGIGFTYSTIGREFQSSARQGCNWCGLLLRMLQHQVFLRRDHACTLFHPQTKLRVRVRIMDPLLLRSTEVPVFRGDFLRVDVDEEESERPHGHMCYYVIHTSSDDNAAQYIAARDRIWRVGADESFTQALSCLAECTTTHRICPKPQQHFIPTRVVDCSNPARPKLHITADSGHGEQTAHYAALSYVWGEDQPAKTRAANINAYTSTGIDVRALPRTIADAIVSTRKLGLRYLWVDALCIVQDSREDKKREIAQMRNIYRGAYVTIVAASAEMVSEGFLHDRRAPAEATALPFRCPDGRVGTMELRSYDDYFTASDPDSMGFTEPVNKRAWCLEERMLSPRVLIYASHTLQFQCQVKMVNVGHSLKDDTFYAGLRFPDLFFSASSATAQETALSVHDRAEVEHAWRGVVARYSGRYLTEPKDKLLALSGVAEEFHRVGRCGDRYLAGLWQHTLLDGLKWAKNKSTEYFPRPPKYRAPSWSWAAIDGSIDALGTSRETHVIPRVESTVRILACEAPPKTPHLPFGEVAGGFLKLEGILVEMVWDPVRNEVFGPEARRALPRRRSFVFVNGWEDRNGADERMPNFVSKTIDMVVPGLVPVGTAYPDSLDEIAAGAGEVWALPLQHISAGPTSASGLLVLEDEAARDCFRRVGWFETKSRVPQTWLDTPKRTITIL